MDTPNSTQRFDHPDDLIDELDASMMVLGRMFSARHAEKCAESHLNVGQAVALRVLGELGSTRIGEVATLLGIKAPAATALVDGLESRGFVERETDPEDRRIHRVALTDAGRAEAAAAEIARREHMRRLLSVLEAEDIKTLIRVQRTLIDALRADHI